MAAWRCCRATSSSFSARAARKSSVSRRSRIRVRVMLISSSRSPKRRCRVLSVDAIRVPHTRYQCRCVGHLLDSRVQKSSSASFAWNSGSSRPSRHEGQPSRRCSSGELPAAPVVPTSELGCSPSRCLDSVENSASASSWSEASSASAIAVPPCSSSLSAPRCGAPRRCCFLGLLAGSSPRRNSARSSPKRPRSGSPKL